MDELLHHCVRELSFDGDLGSDVSRLRDFIIDFYKSSETLQNTDDSFCAFVWSLVAQQPTVRIGIIPAGVNSEVWIAPQTSAVRKANAKGQEHVAQAPTQLDFIPDSKSRPLDDLQKEYGKKLRIAIDPEAIYAAITGSHIRYPKLSPMVYSALQIITRGRDSGVTVVELGQRSKYDQKTCFYLVKQLTEMELVVKVRRGGVGTHFVIHRYFFDRSPSWKEIREEESRADSNRLAEEDIGNDGDEKQDENNASLEGKMLDFTPIDARHLSSLPLVRGRVVKLLKATTNLMHAAKNMLITIGFLHPTKTDRRFFNSRMREMMQQGIIERVMVPVKKQRSSQTSTIICYRLIDENSSTTELDPVVAADLDDLDDGSPEAGGVKMNVTIHKQIVDLLEEAGTSGRTLNELSASLCNFDKRTIELLLTRAEKLPPPSHLSDLGIAGLMETMGRERRHRYFTLSEYRSLVAKENLDSSSAGYGDIDFTDVGEFMSVDQRLFYESVEELHKCQDLSSTIFGSIPKIRASKSNAKAQKKNPVLPDGTAKLGRPRKQPFDDEGKVIPSYTKRPTAMKRKRDSHVVGNTDADVDDGDIKKLPAKKQRTKKDKEPAVEEDVALVLPPKKRGRPPKNQETGEEVVSTLKTRGRPPKKQKESTDVTTPPLKKQPRRSMKGKGKEVEALNTAETAPIPVDVISESAPHVIESTEFPPMEITDVPLNKRDGSLVQDTPMEQALPSDVHTSFDEMGDVHMEAVSEAITDAVLNDQPSSDSISNDASNAPAITDTTTSIPASGMIAVDINMTGSGIMKTNAETWNMALESVNKALDAHVQYPLASDIQPDSVVPARFAKSASKAKVNVSHLRRENEICRVIEEAGGIVNTQVKEFYEAHMKLLVTLTAEGEPTSAPIGTRTDKRTATSTLNSLESKGRLKQIKATMPTSTGLSRPVIVAYLPKVEQERLVEFIAELGRTAPQPPPLPAALKRVDESLDFGSSKGNIRVPLPLQLMRRDGEKTSDNLERWSKNPARADQLWTYDDAIIREVLLTERTTVGQKYGSLVSRILRARELHLYATDVFEKRLISPNVVSQEARIIALPYFILDLSVEHFLRIVPPTHHHDDLTSFLESGRKTMVRDIPPEINKMLQVGRSRSRTRILDLMLVLISLGIVVPLTASTSETPYISCDSCQEYPTSFDIAPNGWNPETPMVAPIYWHFKTVAPLHYWASSDVIPPFWQNLSIKTSDEVATYWDTLKQAATDPSLCIVSQNSESAIGPSVISARLRRSICRGASWNTEYVLTWHQSQYLKRFLDVASAATPLDDEDGGKERITKLSWIVCAPEDVVKRFYSTIGTKIYKELERTKRRNGGEELVEVEKEAKAALVHKAAEARKQKEDDWDNILQRVHPEPLTQAASVRLKRLRSRFLQSVSTLDVGKWEVEVSEVIKEATMISKKVFKLKAREPQSNILTATVAIPLTSTLPPVASNPPEKTIQELLVLQGPPLVLPNRKRKRKRGSNVDEEEEPTPKAPLRRHRFAWTREFDELARDASVIIRARCRNGSRLDWGAFEQVFPAVPRNSVRQRLGHMRESAGTDAYLQRLEDRWYDLWIQHRGSESLPDIDPDSATNFDLIKHLEFLRKHIDKNALRIGYQQPNKSTAIVLPQSVELLYTNFEVVEDVPSAPLYDVLWNGVVEEGREKKMNGHAFSLNNVNNLVLPDIDSDALARAESTVKMVMASPPETYNPDTGANILRCLSQDEVNLATRGLLERGVLSKLVRDPQKQKPGRQLKISEPNQFLLSGPVGREIFQDAAALDDVQQDDWREWPLIANDGDLAALIQATSDGYVDFKINTSDAQAARANLDWNSKKADDDDIETSISVNFLDSGITAIPDHVSSFGDHEDELIIQSSDIGENGIHGSRQDGEPASCRIFVTGLVDCFGCLQNQWETISPTLSPQETSLASLILDATKEAGSGGLTKEEIMAVVQLPFERLLPTLFQLVECAIPLLYWVGYSRSRLISASHLHSWSVILSQDPMKRIFPRRWLDIAGRRVSDVWQAAIRSVIGVIIFKPAISQLEMRWRLRLVYDRLELNDILRYLYMEGFVRFVGDPRMNALGFDINAALTMDGDMEKHVYWFLSEARKWYQA